MAGSNYRISTLGDINFYPETVAEEVVQNVRCIVSTIAGSVPLDRAFGVAWDALDKPIPLARALMQAAVFDAVRQYEPRAVIQSVTWDDTPGDAIDGIMHPVLTLSLADGVDGDALTKTGDDTVTDTTTAAAETAVTATGLVVQTSVIEQAVAAAVAAAVSGENASAAASIAVETFRASVTKLQGQVANIYNSTTTTLDDVPSDASKGGIVVLKKDD